MVDSTAYQEDSSETESEKPSGALKRLAQRLEKLPAEVQVLENARGPDELTFDPSEGCLTVTYGSTMIVATGETQHLIEEFNDWHRDCWEPSRS
jgi:hypothetical protein